MALGDRTNNCVNHTDGHKLIFPKSLMYTQNRFPVMGIHSPSIELLIRMAELFNVSLDYIAFEGREEKNIVPIADRELMQAVQLIDQLSDEDRGTIKAVLNTFIVKNRFQRLASERKKQTASN